MIAINYTSAPRQAQGRAHVLPSARAYLNSLGETFHNGFDGSTKYLWTLPMFHCNGWCTPWAVTAAAGTHVCLRAVRADAVWDAIDDLGITNLCGAHGGVHHHRRCRARPPRRRAAHHDGGAPPSPTVIGQLEALGITVVHVYGLTEVYGPYTICE